MYEQYLEKTAECVKELFIKMTSLEVSDISIEENKRKVVIYPIATTHAYRDEGKNLAGKFVLGFNDKFTAEIIANALGKQVGMSEEDLTEEMKNELLAEFINTLVGHIITDWSNMGMELSFDAPIFGPIAKKEENSENYLILLELPENMYISLGITFDQRQNAEIKNKKILIVDDSLAIRHVLSKVYGDAGCQIDQAKDGIEAVEKFIEFEPDLVIMDLVMPRRDGLAAILEIRKFEQNNKKRLLNFPIGISSKKLASFP